MKVLIAGGSGHVGAILIRHFLARGDSITVLSRSNKPIADVTTMYWDGENQGNWSIAVDGTDLVINLAGRSVNCRYTVDNLNEMMNSRVLSVQAIVHAIQAAKNPPTKWLQSSTATIYAHCFDAPNDEASGMMGGNEPNAPFTWNASIEIAKAWERETLAIQTPKTRKVLMRSAMTMSIDKGSVFDVLSSLTRKGLGGTLGDGKQFVSWIHETDFVNAVSFLIDHPELVGPVNICSPNPLPQRQFARELRQAWHIPLGIPAPAPLVELGTKFMQTESELVLKSRRVAPKLLLDHGFDFKFPLWSEAAKDLVSRYR